MSGIGDIDSPRANSPGGRRIGPYEPVGEEMYTVAIGMTARRPSLTDGPEGDHQMEITVDTTHKQVRVEELTPPDIGSVLTLMQSQMEEADKHQVNLKRELQFLSERQYSTESLASGLAEQLKLALSELRTHQLELGPAQHSLKPKH